MGCYTLCLYPSMHSQFAFEIRHVPLALRHHIASCNTRCPRQRALSLAQTVKNKIPKYVMSVIFC